MDNYWILGKSVEIKVSSKMAGYKMNLPFNAEECQPLLTNNAGYDIIYVDFSQKLTLIGTSGHESSPRDDRTLHVNFFQKLTYTQP